MAVKGKSKADILAAFERRLANDQTPRRGPRSPRSIASPRCGSRTSCHERERARHPRPIVLTSPTIPRQPGRPRAIYLEDGAVLVAGRANRGGRRGARHSRRAPLTARRSTIIRAHSSCPGFIDAHIHYPQTQVIGSYGAQLLDWLHNYTFVEEQKFADPGHCARIAEFFLDELIRCGTTTAMVYCTVHPQSVDAFFAEAERRGARMIAGKTMMDRDAPEALTDTAQRGYDESKALIERWRRTRAARLCGHAALRRDLERGATGGRRRAGARISRGLRPDPSRRKHGRDRSRRRAVSRSADLSRRL